MTHSLHEAYLSMYSEGFVPLNPFKVEVVGARALQLADKIRRDRQLAQRLRNIPFSNIIPPVANRIQELQNAASKNLGHVKDIQDALKRTNIEDVVKNAGPAVIRRLEGLYLDAKNRIVPFQREEVEMILNYLLDEGYADSLNSAEVIFESMSDEWLSDILNEGTFKQAVMRLFGGMGQSDYPGQNPRSLSDIKKQQQRAEAAMRGNIPLNQATYWGRVEAGRNSPGSRYQGVRPADNPDFIGPLKGAGEGTADRRMPGTSPSNNPNLPIGPQRHTKGTTRHTKGTNAGRYMGFT